MDRSDYIGVKSQFDGLLMELVPDDGRESMVEKLMQVVVDDMAMVLMAGAKTSQMITDEYMKLEKPEDRFVWLGRRFGEEELESALVGAVERASTSMMVVLAPTMNQERAELLRDNFRKLALMS